MKKCPICGKEYAEGATCVNCGMVLIDMESAKPVDVVQEKKDQREKEKQNLREKRDQERQQKIEQRQAGQQTAAHQAALNPRILIIAAICAVAVIVCIAVVMRGRKTNTVQGNTAAYDQTQEIGDDQDYADAAESGAVEDGAVEDNTAVDATVEEVTLNEKDFAQTDLVAYGTETFQFSLPEYWGNLCEAVTTEDSVTFYQDRSEAAGYSGELFSVMRVYSDALTGYDNYSILAADSTYTYIVCYPVSAAYDTSDEYTALEYERLLDDVATIQSSFTYTETGSDYVIEDSNSRYLTVADLESLTADELKYARNEIYARHGRKFKDETIQAYFDSKDWYTGTIEPDDFTQSMLNEYEKANATLILSYEKEQGYVD